MAAIDPIAIGCTQRRQISRVQMWNVRGSRTWKLRESEPSFILSATYAQVMCHLRGKTRHLLRTAERHFKYVMALFCFVFLLLSFVFLFVFFCLFVCFQLDWYRNRNCAERAPIMVTRIHLQLSPSSRNGHSFHVSHLNSETHSLWWAAFCHLITASIDSARMGSIHPACSSVSKSPPANIDRFDAFKSRQLWLDCKDQDPICPNRENWLVLIFGVMKKEKKTEKENEK